MPARMLIRRIFAKAKALKWGKIEIIVRDRKITQINTIEEERLNSGR